MGRIVLTDDPPDDDIRIALTPAGQPLREFLIGLRRHIVACDVDMEIGDVHPRVNRDQLDSTPRCFVEGNGRRQLGCRRTVDTDHHRSIDRVLRDRLLVVNHRHGAVGMVQPRPS